MESRIVRKLWRSILVLTMGAMLFGGPVAAAKSHQPWIVGTWQFYKMIYKGQLQDPLNPNLIMTFDFQEDGVNTLAFHRTDEEGFCERSALWIFNSDKNELYQRITWLNPQSRSDCSADPDFQLGHESFSPLRVTETQLFLTVPVSDEQLILVWKRINSL
jgi:hypothetical protein